MKIRIIILSILTVMISCKRDVTVPDSQQNEFLSLKVGNTWEFTGLTLRITDKIIRDNKLYFILESTISSKTYVNITYYYVRISDSSKVYYIDYSREINGTFFRLDSTEYLRFDFLKNVGETWLAKQELYEFADTSIYYDKYGCLVENNATVRLNDTISLSNCYTFYYDTYGIADAIEYTMFAKGIGFVDLWEAWGGSGKLKRVILNGKETVYN